MTTRTILTSVGTSLLTNSDRPWAPWRHKQPLPEAAVVEAWLSGADPIKASAETHTWFRLGLFDSEEKDRVQVVVIHSQTPDGQFCGERLCELAQNKGFHARTRQVDGLDYSDGSRFQRGLRQLARVIGEEIKLGRAAGSVELAATGGFKAEIAVANLVGAVSETPVHYIYQEFSSLITIEPIPVTLRGDWIAQGPGRKLLETFASKDAIVPLTSIDSLLKQDERLWGLVEVAGDDAGLTLLGEIAVSLMQTPAESWPPACDDDPQKKIRLDSAAHHRPRGWERIVQSMARSRYVTSIRYEGSASGGNFKEATDNVSDLIHRIEGDGGPPLVLRISTSATNEAQRRLVQQLLRKEIA